MRLSEVLTLAQAREFLEFPVRLYAGDPNYVRPLDRDIETVFDREREALSTCATGGCGHRAARPR